MYPLQPFWRGLAFGVVVFAATSPTAIAAVPMKPDDHHPEHARDLAFVESGDRVVGDEQARRPQAHHDAEVEAEDGQDLDQRVRRVGRAA